MTARSGLKRSATCLRRHVPPTLLLVALVLAGSCSHDGLGPGNPSGWELVAAGGTHTCALTLAGAAYCWGANGSGQLGDGTTTDRLKPTAVSGGLQFRTITVGGSHSCGVTTSGEASCWGDNTYGQLGDGSGADRLTPTPIHAQFRTVFVALSAGSIHTCGLTSAGVPYCWGWNHFNQLGDGSTTDRAVPTPVADGLTFQTLSLGYAHTCGLTAAGAAYCWGQNAYGQVGDGSLTRQARPTAVAGNMTFASLEAGDYHTCGLTGAGTAYCWGADPRGQLGDGSTTNRGTPTNVAGGVRFERLAAGASHTCGIAGGGAAHCWGAGGTVGDGADTDRALPVAVSGGLAFASVSAGGGHTCGLTTVGTAYCWGSNYSGELGAAGVPTAAEFWPPAVVSGGLTFNCLAAGGFHTCGATPLGRRTAGAATTAAKSAMARPLRAARPAR